MAMKRVLLLLVIIVIVCFAGEGLAQGKKVFGQYSILVYENGTCAINQYDGNEKKIVVPQKIGEYQVVEIGDGAFGMREDIEEITLPEGILRIGENAFSGLKN